jgi:predicted amidohydrolase
MQSGVFQCDGGGLTSQERLAKMEAMLEHNRLDLIVCPELFLSGYNVGNALSDLAQAPDSILNQQIARMARHSETAIIYGYPERDGDTIYNACACISAQGQVIARQRKLALPPGFETQVFDSGDNFCLFDLAGFRCGILICYDAEFPESVRALAQAGAELVIVPTALTHEWGIVAERVMPTRAFENGIWLIYANHAGVENGTRYLGASCIISPDGTDAARAGAEEQLIIAELDSAQVLAAQNRLPYLKDVADLNNKLIRPQ